MENGQGDRVADIPNDGPGDDYYHSLLCGVTKTGEVSR